MSQGQPRCPLKSGSLFEGCFQGLAGANAFAASLSSLWLRENSLVSGAEPEIFRATSLHLSPGGWLGEKRKQIELGKQRVELWWDLSQQALGVLSYDFQSTDADHL